MQGTDVFDNSGFESVWEANIAELQEMRDAALRIDDKDDVDSLQQVLRRVARLRGVMFEHKRQFEEAVHHYHKMYEDVQRVVSHAMTSKWH